MTIKSAATSALALSLLFVAPIFSCLQAAESTDFVQEQIWFMEAREALAAKDTGAFTRLKNQLKDYPLYGYLEYEELEAQFNHSQQPSAAELALLAGFKEKGADKVYVNRLMAVLQRRLAATKNWPLFLELSSLPGAQSMSCDELKARVATKKVSILDEQALSLWTQPKKYPGDCQQVLDELEQAAAPPIKAIWERIYTAFEEDKPKYAESVLHYLGSRDKALIQAWLDALEDPEPYLTSGALAENTMHNRRAVVDLVLAWSKKDPVAAMNHWLSVYPNYTFFDDRYYDTHRLLAMRGAYRRLPEAYDWLNSLEGREDDLELQEWRIRAVLFDQNWTEVMRSIKALPEVEQKEDHWAYWEARALEVGGKHEQAQAIYKTLSELATYHGFLAADKLGLEYAIRDEPIQADNGVLDRLSEHPGLVRAREFHRVSLPEEGRREWNAVQTIAAPAELAAMALLAERWGMIDRAIFSAGKAEQLRAVSTRFPMVYRQLVDDYAKEQLIDPAWVFGVIRRESAYIPDVRSSAGAIGLMQLMPATAKFVAGKLGDKKWRGDLTEIETNINFGTYYLRYVLDKFDDHIVLATASYNAGPNRVKTWLPEAEEEAMPADVWIDSIPYSETRRYVRAVLAYMAIYEWQMAGKPIQRLGKLPEIPAAVVEPEPESATE